METTQTLNHSPSDDGENTFRIIPALPRHGLELTAIFNDIRSVRHAVDLELKKRELIYEQCWQGVLLDDGGIAISALCELYFLGDQEQCADCPIRKAGHPQCQGTPYWDYQAALEVNNLPLAKAAAEEEMTFLEGLIDDQGSQEFDPTLQMAGLQG